MIIASTGLALALALAATPPEAGRYTLNVLSSDCVVRLNPTNAPLPESNLSSADAAGLALVMPGCPGTLSDAIFWRFDGQTDVLSLFDGSGTAVFEARSQDGVWQGQTADGVPATLSRP